MSDFQKRLEGMLVNLVSFKRRQPIPLSPGTDIHNRPLPCSPLTRSNYLKHMWAIPYPLLNWSSSEDPVYCPVLWSLSPLSMETCLACQAPTPRSPELLAFLLVLSVAEAYLSIKGKA